MINLKTANCVIILSLLCNLAFASESKSEKSEGPYVSLSEEFEGPSVALDDSELGDPESISRLNLHYLAVRIKFYNSWYVYLAAGHWRKNSGEITVKDRTIKYKFKDKKKHGSYLYLLFKEPMTTDDIMAMLSETYLHKWGDYYYPGSKNKYYIANDGLIEINGITLDNIPKKKFYRKRNWHDVVTVKETITRPELTLAEIDEDS